MNALPNASIDALKASSLIDRDLGVSRNMPRYPWTGVGPWSTVGPDRAVYFTRDRSSSEINALHLSEK